MNQSPNPTVVHEAVQALHTSVSRALERTNGHSIIRVAVSVPKVDPFRWLDAQASGSRSLWSSRDNTRVIAMTGVADMFVGSGPADYGRLSRYLGQQLAEAAEGVRYYGGVRFDSGREASQEWDGFGSVRFFLPRIELLVDGDQAELVCNLVVHRDRGARAELLGAIEALAWPEATEVAELPHATGRHDQPARPEWLDRVCDSLGAIDRLEIQKVVLARRSSFQFDDHIPTADLIRRLHAETPNRFHYLFEVEDGTTFLGATPERLVRREETYVFTEAVAGTRPAVDNEADDAQLRAALLASDKEQREHLCVRWAIEEVLEPFCENLVVDAHASEMRLSQGRHLVSRFNGVLRDRVDSWDLVRHLHPTPAVGGYPAPAAMRVIRRTETFDRGWYAGPVGWVGRDEAEFAVALRCALVHEDHMHVYSGAGIVEGSQPEAEWDEIEHKIIDFARVLGLAGVEAT